MFSEDDESDISLINDKKKRADQILFGRQNYFAWHRLFICDAATQGILEWFNGDTKMPPKPIFPNFLRYELGVADGVEIPERAIAETDILVEDFELFKLLREIWEDHRKEHFKAQRLLRRRIDPSFFALIENDESIFEKMTIIRKTCLVKTDALLDELLSQIEAIRLTQDMTVSEYVMKHIEIQRDIHSLDSSSYSDRMLKNKLIRGLPKSWESFVWMYKMDLESDVVMDVPALMRQLLSYELILNDGKGEKKNFKGQDKNKNIHNNNSNNGKEQTNFQNNKKCGHCKLKSHSESNCYFLHPEKAPTSWTVKAKDKS